MVYHMVDHPVKPLRPRYSWCACGYARCVSFPVGPWLPVLLVSLQPLTQSSWAGRLPNIPANQPFWASSRDAPGLIAAGFAEPAPSGTTAPPVEPPLTAHGTPGFAAGTSNSSRPATPSRFYAAMPGDARVGAAEPGRP